MEDIVFSIYKNNKVQQITFQDLALNKRVLICSAVRITQYISDLYIRELLKQIPVYKQQGIDEIYVVINSSYGLYGLARLDKMFPELEILADSDNKFVKWLSDEVKKTSPDLDTLSKYWTYQVLLNNGTVEKFYEQPTKDYIKHLIRAGFKPSAEQQLFLRQGEQTVLFRPILKISEQRNLTVANRDAKKIIGTDIPYPYHQCTPLEFMYFNLCPNKKLNEYLLDTNKQTSV
jgi:peroxiredoxin